MQLTLLYALGRQIHSTRSALSRALRSSEPRSTTKMPLYELVCITKHHTSLVSPSLESPPPPKLTTPPQWKQTPLQTLIRSSASLIADNGGVVRHLDHWGTRNLPQRMKVGKRRGGGGGGGGGLEDGSSSTGE